MCEGRGHAMILSGGTWAIMPITTWVDGARRGASPFGLTWTTMGIEVHNGHVPLKLYLESFKGALNGPFQSTHKVTGKHP